MCGITGIVGLNGAVPDVSALHTMTNSLGHRGPDDGAVHMCGTVGFGFRRLAILDLSPAARQPMVSEDGKLVLVFNGEIFNYVELRNELESLGYEFKSSGDTEVLLHAYRQWGRECLRRLNGMWAFVIYDSTHRLLFGSRDRFGIKPLYYYQNRDYFLFGSEIKAITASGLFKSSPNWQVIADYLLEERLDESSDTFFQDIKQIAPGTAFELNFRGEMSSWRYWSLDTLPKDAAEDPIRSFAELFDDSVRIHMRSDVPVGVCLSGGLDSTSIICSMARLRNGSQQPLLAFSYNAPEYDESAYVADTIRDTHADLRRVHTDPVRLWSLLETFLSFHDEPVHSMTALIGFELMGLAAANGVKVILNGQGSDETIAGYPSYFRDYWYTLLKTGLIRSLWQEIQSYGAFHGGVPSVLFLNILKHFLRVQMSRANYYRRVARFKRRVRMQRAGWFHPELANHLAPDERGDSDWSLNGVLRRSVERAPLPLYLRVEDRNSMAHSVEARLPFLDHRLVSFAFSLAANWKMRGPWNKFVLREAMRDRIPESVRSRVDKMGFPVPAKTWFSGVLYDRVHELIEARETRERGIYDLKEVRRDLELHRQGRVDISPKLFQLVQMEMWFSLLGDRVVERSLGRVLFDSQGDIRA
jgi:asparagine synthase (glutamine-hydrolysing)